MVERLPAKQECHPQRLVNNCPECTGVPTVLFNIGGFGKPPQRIKVSHVGQQHIVRRKRKCDNNQLGAR